MSTLCGVKSKHLQVALSMGPGKYRHNLSTNGSFKLCIQGPLELNSKCATHSVGFLNLLKGEWEGAFFHDSRLDWQWVVLVWLPQRCTCININMVPLLKRKKNPPQEALSPWVKTALKWLFSPNLVCSGSETGKNGPMLMSPQGCLLEVSPAPSVCFYWAAPSLCFVCYRSSTSLICSCIFFKDSR